MTINKHSEEWRTLKEGERIGYALGAFLGFPRCCTKQFLESSLPQLKAQHQKLIGHPLKGTGFVPCDHCITLDPNELVANINANRTFIHPFPFKGGVLATAGDHFEEFKQKYDSLHYNIPDHQLDASIKVISELYFTIHKIIKDNN